MCDTSVTWCVYSLALSPSLSVTGICCRPGTDARPFAPLSVMLLYVIFSNKATMIKRFSVLKPWPAASLLTTADKRFGIIKARWKRVYLIFKWLIRKERNCVCCLKSIHAIKETFFKLWKLYMIILYTYDRGVARIFQRGGGHSVSHPGYSVHYFDAKQISTVSFLTVVFGVKVLKILQICAFSPPKYCMLSTPGPTGAPQDPPPPRYTLVNDIS